MSWTVIGISLNLFVVDRMCPSSVHRPCTAVRTRGAQSTATRATTHRPALSKIDVHSLLFTLNWLVNCSIHDRCCRWKYPACITKLH